MENAGRVAIIIPCFNEAATIGAVIEGARSHVHSVWVIDDGSADNTAQIAEAEGAMVRRNYTNLGKGAALREGLAALDAAGFEWAITMDGDGQHDASDLPKFIREIANGADLVIGNRVSKAGEMSWLRRKVNAWMSRQIGARLRMECPDSQCGFRLIRLGAWNKLEFRTRRYEIESEMIVGFVKAGFKVEFVPINVIAPKRPSRISPVRDTIRWLRWWLRN